VYRTPFFGTGMHADPALRALLYTDPHLLCRLTTRFRNSRASRTAAITDFRTREDSTRRSRQGSFLEWVDYVGKTAMGPEVESDRLGAAGQAARLELRPKARCAQAAGGRAVTIFRHHQRRWRSLETAVCCDARRRAQGDRRADRYGHEHGASGRNSTCRGRKRRARAGRRCPRRTALRRN